MSSISDCGSSLYPWCGCVLLRGVGGAAGIFPHLRRRRRAHGFHLSDKEGFLPLGSRVRIFRTFQNVSIFARQSKNKSLAQAFFGSLKNSRTLKLIPQEKKPITHGKNSRFGKTFLKKCPPNNFGNKHLSLGCF